MYIFILMKLFYRYYDGVSVKKVKMDNIINIYDMIFIDKKKEKLGYNCIVYLLRVYLVYYSSKIYT